ncbi:hypothetical protein FRC09_009610 [Ceratobasidium sp. 395]|nr:hypothetical protein FRC09_009610 [Ceratobasidium sp. 395]
MFKRKGVRAPRNASSTTSANVTVLGRTQAPSTVHESHRPSMLVPKARKVTKAKLSIMQERDKARNEMLLKDKLSDAQKKELDALRRQVSGSEPVDLDLQEDTMDAYSWVDIEHKAGSDDEGQEEIDIVEELGLPSNNSAWSNRLSAEHEVWTTQLPNLCDAYLAYCAGIRLSEPMKLDESELSVTLPCIGVSTERSMTFPLPGPDSWVNTTLVLHGFLAPSPSCPTVAISLELLDILAAMQRQAPSASVEALSKALSDLCNVGPV